MNLTKDELVELVDFEEPRPGEPGRLTPEEMAAGWEELLHRIADDDHGISNDARPYIDEKEG